MAKTPRWLSARKALAFLSRFPYSALAVSIAAIVLLGAMLGNVDIFELRSFDFIGIEKGETGEISIAFLLIIPAVFLDLRVNRQRSHEAEIRSEQLRVVGVTMRTVQDIVNNNLNQLQLLRLEAEGCVPEASLRLFDQIIQDTATELTALANLTSFVEQPLEIGSALVIPAA